MRGGTKVLAKFRGAAIALPLVSMLLSGCDDTRRDWQTCNTEPCGPGHVCNIQNHRCVPVLDASVADGGTDALLRIDGTPIPGSLDSPLASDVPHGEVGGGDTFAPVVIDAAPETAIDAPPGPALDAEIDSAADAPLDLAIDTRVPDAAGTCSSDGDCAGQTPFCVEWRCVACKTSGECQGGAPICSSSHACVSCALADAGCPATAPACEVDSGRCVECVSNDGCGVATKPICDSASYTCVSCTSDDQCAAVGPSVCMFHLDGRCAADAETIYVGSRGSATCSDTATSAGSAQTPYCTAQKGVLAARAKGRPLVVLAGALAGGFTGIALTAPLTVVGKDAIITPADFSDGIGITSGEIYLRGLSVAGSAAGQTGIGINAQATAGATLILHMDGCAVTGNPGGGILLGGAAFDIRNTRVAGNGPGQTSGGATFGGIRVDSLPSSGPTSLELVTIADNLAPGLSCWASIQGTGVLASGNILPVITNSCGVVNCAVPSATCGAQ
jgi:hypothetical protein